MTISVVYKVEQLVEVDDKFRPLDCSMHEFLFNKVKLDALYGEFEKCLDKKADELFQSRMPSESDTGCIVSCDWEYAEALGSHYPMASK